jgi:hypothetical protein
LGIASPLWSRRAIGELIRKECDVVLAVRTVGEYLRRWGYTAKKPARHARKQDPEEVRQWLERTHYSVTTSGWTDTRPSLLFRLPKSERESLEG